MSGARVAVVIPTRNRPDLARRALGSVLPQLARDGRAFVSDNSSEPNRERLAAACDDLGDPRLTYVSPPEELPMSPHWQWALERVLEDDDLTHVTFLTDRMVFRDGELATVCRIAGDLESDVVSYNFDHVDDSGERPILVQYAWTGAVWRLDARRLLRESALGRFPPCTPRMLNCIVPREVFDRLSTRFGRVFDSAAPDYCFAYRCLALLDSTLHYDKSALIDANYDRSVGASYFRGRLSTDAVDFVDSVGAGAINGATPLPEVPVYPNAMFNEYCVAMAQSGSGKFTPVSRGRYLASLARGGTTVEDPELRARVYRTLAEAGWRGWFRRWHGFLSGVEILPYALHPRDFLRRILWRKRRRLEASRIGRALLRRLGMLPPPGDATAAEVALAYANAHPGERLRRPAGLPAPRERVWPPPRRDVPRVSSAARAPDRAL